MSTPSVLDLVFVLDCTGSMGSYIKSACDNIQKIVDDVSKAEKCDVRFSLVRYRDFCDQHSTFLVKAENFTSSLREMKRYLEQTSAVGGGDAPEAVASGLHAAAQLPYRPNAVRIVVWIADAPPHGLCPDHGDSLPNGDTGCPDILEIVEDLAKKEVIVYAVGVEPAVGSYQTLRGFMRGVADRTGGRYVPLGNAPLLAAVITGGAREEINLERVADQVVQEVEQLRLAPSSRHWSEDQLYTAASSNLQARGVTVGQLEVDDIVGEDKESDEIASVVKASKKLSDAVSAPAVQKARKSAPMAADSRSSAPSSMKLMMAPRMSSAAPAGGPSAAFASYAMAPPTSAPMMQKAAYTESPISMEQVKRITTRKSAPVRSEKS